MDAKERILRLISYANVLDGCVYIVSRLTSPGVITETGNIHSLYFGAKNVDPKKLRHLLEIFTNASIDAHQPEDIQKVIWEKFFFISTIASLTTFLDKPIGAILQSEADKKLLNELFRELKAITLAKGIVLAEDIAEKTLLRLHKLPYETTSSMHSDLKKGNQTEYVSLTEYVVKLGKELHILTPMFDKILNVLNKKTF